MNEDLVYITARRKPLPEVVASISQEVKELSRFVYTHPELGSEEYQAYDAFVSRLKSHNIKVQERYLDMDTAFLAEVGEGGPRVAVFAEYDALPIGHACGHNLLGAWAYGVTLAFKKSPPRKGTLYLVGSPAEEGRGKYASSKVVIAPKLKEMGVEAVFAVHPAGEWGVGGGLLATQRYQFVFHGRDAHPPSSGHLALNALDAAVHFYIQARMQRNQVRREKDVIISAIIKDGGVAPNILPGRAEVWLDIRSNDSGYLPELAQKIQAIAEGAAKMTGCTVEYKLLAPPTDSWKRNEGLERLMVKHASEYLEKFLTPEEAWSRPPVASADTATVSQHIPSVHLSMKIGREGMPGHSQEWKEAAGTKEAEEALMTAIAIGYEAVKDYCESH
jgi:amidohydrolase